jgi:hypothetical protein
MSAPLPSAPLIRFGLVLAYAIAAFLLAHLVSDERSEARAEPAAPPTREEGTDLDLRIDLQASRPIAEWRITLDGTPLETSLLSDLEGSIRSSVTIREGSRLILDLMPEDPESGTPFALRLDLTTAEGTRSETFWSSGEMVEAVPLDTWLKQPSKAQ